MTKIYIKGLLGKIFGTTFSMKVPNAMSAIKAIDANKNGFIKTLFDLKSQGYDYYIVVDNEYIKNEYELKEKRTIDNIYIIPALVGFGAAVAALIVGAEAVASQTLSAVLIETVVNVLISSAISLGISYIASKMQNEGTAPQQYIAVGGAASSIQAAGKSYVFSNNLNTAKQGSAVPVGYGRMRVSSNVINVSIKNYAVNEAFQTETSSQTISYNPEFLTLN